jgi:ribosomal protein S1
MSNKYPPNISLKKEREQRNWTHADVAEKIGLPDPHTVGLWEGGMNFPGPRYRRELCRVFGKSMPELGLLKSQQDTDMADSFEKIALDQSILRKQWLPLDVAVQEVLAFEKLFGTGHFLLACHAALPSLLTPELLHFIRLNFLDQQKPRTPWIAEMDLLLSPLCRPVERDLFEVEPMVREALLFKLEEHYGWQQLQNVADFLLQYLHKNHTTKRNAAVTQLHEWIAQSYLEPDKIVQELVHLLNESIDPQSNDYQKLPKKLRIARTMELLADPLRHTTLQEDYAGLVHSARVLAYTLYGNKATFPTKIRATGSESERDSMLFPPAVQQWLSTITTSQTSQSMEEGSTESVDTIDEGTEVEENRVDRMLRLAGWIVQDIDAVNVEGAGAQGIAIREFPFVFFGINLFPSAEFLGYLLVVDGEAVGAIDIQKELSPSIKEGLVYEQTALPARPFPTPIRSIRTPLPFFYATTGFDALFINRLEPEYRSRRIFTFHRPETLARWLGQAPAGTPNNLNDLLRSRLHRMPAMIQSEIVSYVQLEAISALEKSMAINRSRALIQIPNGRGKTKSLVYLAFRLLKFAHARRILCLVDNESILPRTYHRFEQAGTLYMEDTPVEQFNIQVLQNNSIDPAAQICISTVEQLYSTFSDIQLFDKAHGSDTQLSPEQRIETPDKINSIQYNPSIPIEFFDIILIYDCAPDTYRQQQPLLEYFDAFIIGATESMDRQILSFFNENLVYNYNRGHTPSLIAQRLWKYYDELRDYGFSYDDYMEQLTYLLFLKGHQYSRLRHLGELHIPEDVDWGRLLNQSPHELTSYYQFILHALGDQRGLIGTIFRAAQNKIQDGNKLWELIALINREYPPGMGSNMLGDIYEELLEKNATNLAFTPRALIQAIVDVMRPKPKIRLCDPACGTGGFLIAAYTYAECLVKNSEEQRWFEERFLNGWDRHEKLIKFCGMNLLAHNIVSEGERSLVRVEETLRRPLGDELFDMVLCNPPFGLKNIATGGFGSDGLGINTRDGDLAYIEFIFALLKTNGRAAIVIPNSVLFRGGQGQNIRRRLLDACDLHTILLLPSNVFYETSIPTAVLFFDKIPPNDRPGTKELWIYDLRTNQHFTPRKNPLRRGHLEDFVRCYNPENRHERKETEHFRKFTYEELIKRDRCNLNITWLDATDQKSSEQVPEDINRLFTTWLEAQQRSRPTPFTDEQFLWLERIRDQIATSGKFEEKDFNGSPFELDGGLVAARLLFGNSLPTILRELNEVLGDGQQEQLSSNTEEMNRNETEALLALLSTPINIKRGDAVEGVIMRIDQDEILVDIGLKSEGVILTKELPASGYGSFNELHLNDKVLVYVIQPETSEGHAVLSLKWANTERQWRIAEDQYKNGELLKARVIDFNKDGLIVDVAGIPGLVPISQILNLKREEVAAGGENQETAAKLQAMKDKEPQLKIIEINRARNRLILSERLAAQEWRQRRREELLDELKPGEVRPGVVSNLANFGAFVDLGGTDGLVHISQLAWSRVNHPSEILHIGQHVKVLVLSVDKDKKKIALSIKRAEVDPWTTVEKRHTPGQVVTGVVTKIAPFGAFARIEDGIEGLIHHSELPPGADPKAVLYEGAQLQLRILRIDAERRRLGLSLCQTDEAEEGAATTEQSNEVSPAQTGSTEVQVPASTTPETPSEADLSGVSNTTSSTPSLESLPAHPEHTTKRESKRERAERAADNSILGGLRNSGEGELTAMAEALARAARQRSSKEENGSPD